MGVLLTPDCFVRRGGGGHRNAAGFTANLIMAAPSAFTHDAMQNALSEMQISIGNMLASGKLTVS